MMAWTAEKISKNRDSGTLVVTIMLTDGQQKVVRELRGNLTEESIATFARAEAQSLAFAQEKVADIALGPVDLTPPVTAKPSDEDVERAAIFGKEAELGMLWRRQEMKILKPGQAERIAELQLELA